MEHEKALWTHHDALAGKCRPDDIGQPKNEDLPAEKIDPQETTETLLNLSAAVALAELRGIAPTDAEGLALIMLELDPEGFARRNPTLYMDLMRQQRGAKEAAAATALTLAQLTGTKLGAMRSAEVAVKLAAAVMEEAEDVRDRILVKWGIGAEELDAITAAAADDDDLDHALGLTPLQRPVSNYNGVYRVAGLPEATDGPIAAPQPTRGAFPLPADDRVLLPLPVNGPTPAPAPQRWGQDGNGLPDAEAIARAMESGRGIP